MIIHHDWRYSLLCPELFSNKFGVLLTYLYLRSHDEDKLVDTGLETHCGLWAVSYRAGHDDLEDISFLYGSGCDAVARDR